MQTFYLGYLLDLLITFQLAAVQTTITVHKAHSGLPGRSFAAEILHRCAKVLIAKNGCRFPRRQACGRILTEGYLAKRTGSIRQRES